MAKKVLILDSCVLCVWLKVPGKETFGSKGDRVDYDMVKAKIEHEMDAGTTLYYRWLLSLKQAIILRTLIITIHKSSNLPT